MRFVSAVIDAEGLRPLWEASLSRQVALDCTRMPAECEPMSLLASSVLQWFLLQAPTLAFRSDGL